MELYLPPTYAKITKGCDFYETTETFKRRSAASKEKACRYWSDQRHRRRVCSKTAKPVDVFTKGGELVASYPSSRKAAIGIFPDKDYRMVERCIRKCRAGHNKSYKGYMFRDHIDGVERVEPYKVKPKSGGYHVKRRKGTNHTRRVRVVFPDETELRFGSIKECAEAIHGTPGGIWQAWKGNRKYKGLTIIKE